MSPERPVVRPGTVTPTVTGGLVTQLVSPNKPKVGQFGYYSMLKARCVNQSGLHPTNLAFRLFTEASTAFLFPVGESHIN
jgi:hypothetical protein